MRSIYILIKRLRKVLNVFFCGFLFLIFNPCYSQQRGAEKKYGTNEITKMSALQIGDTVPDIFWHIKHQALINNEPLNFTFKEEGKFILLDFWATWCTVCVREFPKVDSLYQSLKDDVTVVLVNQKGNRDTKESIIDFFERYHSRYPYAMDMPQIYVDSVLSGYFEHRSIPYYVLISPKGRVLSIGGNRAIPAIMEILNLGIAQANSISQVERRERQ